MQEANYLIQAYNTEGYARSQYIKQARKQQRKNKATFAVIVTVLLSMLLAFDFIATYTQGFYLLITYLYLFYTELRLLLDEEVLVKRMLKLGITFEYEGDE